MDEPTTTELAALPPEPGAPRRRWRRAAVALGVLVPLATGAAVVVPWWLDGNEDAYRSQVAAGRSHTCALVDGDVSCWGDNSSGQLGDGTNEPSNRAVPVLELGPGVQAISGSGSHTCAVTASGAVKCWGDNSRGQLGNGVTTSSAVPVDVLGLEGGVRTVSAGPDHSCALTRDRAVLCWGANGSSQLGAGDSLDHLTPAPVAGLPARVTGVAAGNGFTCVVFTGRTVRCWGDNSDGQLGLGDTTPRLSWEALSLPRTSFANAGEAHACAVTRDGQAWCWGANWAGQLGDGAAATHSTTPVRVAGPQVRVLSAGHDRTCAVTAQASVVCWGGLPASGSSEPERASGPVEVAGPAGARDVAVGAFHACATYADGVRCWGNNSSGQLGNGTADDSTEPVLVVGG